MENRRTSTYLWRAQPATLQRLRVYCAKNGWALNAVVDAAVTSYLDKCESIPIPPAPPDIRPRKKPAFPRMCGGDSISQREIR